MANFSALKQSIQNYIKQNGNREITGNLLQNILLSMVTTMGDGAINDNASDISDIKGDVQDIDSFISAITTRLNTGALYAGYATPSTTPAALTGQEVFYLATQAGTYTNFHFNGGDDPIVLTKDGIYFIVSGSDDDDWNAEPMLQLDDVPTASSNNAVKSGGLYENLSLPLKLLEDSIGFQLEESVNILNTYNRDAGATVISFPLSIDIDADKEYIIEYSNINKIPSYFGLGNSLGQEVMSLKSYISVGSGKAYFTATSDAKFLRIWDQNAVSGTVKIYQLIGTSEVVEDIEDLETQTSAITINRESIINNLVDISIYRRYSYVSINQNAELVFGQSVRSSFVRKYKIKPNIYVYLHNMLCIYHNSKTYFITDENGNVLKASDTYVIRTSAVPEETIVTPENSAYLYCTGKAAILSAKNKPYEGMSILSLGDSYTMQNYYGKFLEDETGCTQRGRGQNGAGIGNFCVDRYDVITGQQVSEPFDWALVNPYDIITIMGGTNNFGVSTPIGTPEDDISVDSLWGQCKKVITKILTLKPDAKIIYCTQPYRVANPDYHNGAGGYNPNSAGLTLEETMDACIRIFSYYGIPCFDFYHECGWNSFNNKVTNPELLPSSGRWGNGPFRDNIYTLDGLHPRNDEGNGADMLGRAFGKFINKLKLQLFKIDCRICGKVTTDGTNPVPEGTKLTFTNETISLDCPTTSTDINGCFIKTLPVGTWNIVVDGYSNVSPSQIVVEGDDDWTTLDGMIVSN